MCIKIIHEPVSIFKRLLCITSLFVLLAPEPGVGVGDLDGQLSCPLHDQLPVLGGDVVGDLSTVGPTGSKEKGLLGAEKTYFYRSHLVKICLSVATALVLCGPI